MNWALFNNSSLEPIKYMFKKIIPRALKLPLLYNYLRMSGRLDNEILLLKNELKACTRAIDIGANVGIYSYALSSVCKHVESFEPMSECTKILSAYAQKRKNITVYNVGLSNKTGDATFYVPLMSNNKELNIGLASVNDFGGERECFVIQLKRLDDYNFSDVGFIKIDVEGHELEVIEGALETIKRGKSIILVEIEQRHLKTRKIDDVIAFILSLGYEGGYYQEGVFHPIEEFSYEMNQKPFLEDVCSKLYVNNFFFRPVSK